MVFEPGGYQLHAFLGVFVVDGVGGVGNDVQILACGVCKYMVVEADVIANVYLHGLRPVDEQEAVLWQVTLSLPFD